MADAGQYVILGGGAVVVITAIVGLATFLLSNNTVAATHTEQIAALTATVVRLEEKVAHMGEEIVLQRSLKHDMRQDLTKATFPLSMVAEAEDFETIRLLQPTIRSVVADIQAKENHRRMLEDAAAVRSEHEGEHR